MAKDKFESGIFWELYKDLEAQFKNFLEYVPYLDGNEKTYSPKLLNLVLSIGGHVDSAFKEMARYPEFSNNNDCKEILEKVRKGEIVPITLPLAAFEKEYKLSQRTVMFKRIPEREGVKPFQPRQPRAKSPVWWKIYNGLKHDVSINIKKANLETVLNALAGAFLLNVVHIPAYLRLLEYEVLRPKRGGTYSYSPEVKESVIEMYKRGKWFGYLETSLFIYDLEAEAIKVFKKPT